MQRRTFWSRVHRRFTQRLVPTASEVDLSLRSVPLPALSVDARPSSPIRSLYDDFGSTVEMRSCSPSRRILDRMHL